MKASAGSQKVVKTARDKKKRKWQETLSRKYGGRIPQLELSSQGPDNAGAREKKEREGDAVPKRDRFHQTAARRKKSTIRNRERAEGGMSI